MSQSMKQEVRKHHDHIASIYEMRKHDFYMRTIRKAIGHVRFTRMVDLGCGTGLVLSWFEGERVGIDFSEELLSHAHKGPNYILADVESLPLKGQCVDLVLCTDVLEHTPSLKVIEEGHRILTRQGVLHLSTANKRYGVFLEILEKLGLKLPEGPRTWRSTKEIVRKFQEMGFSCTRWSSPPITFYRGTKT